MSKWVYGFGGGAADGSADMGALLGGKGANLAEVSSLGLPVPPGFPITTEACVHYFSNGQSYPDALADQVKAGLAKVEQITGKTFGDVKNPLLVSVRSGARASMPGMMDTVLNLGLNDESAAALAGPMPPSGCRSCNEPIGARMAGMRSFCPNSEPERSICLTSFSTLGRNARESSPWRLRLVVVSVSAPPTR